MCDQCIDALRRYFPELPESEAVSLLWNETSFPFGKATEIEQQLLEIAREKFIAQEIGSEEAK